MNKTILLPKLLGVFLATIATWSYAGMGLDVSLGLTNIRPDIESPVVGVSATNEVKPIVNLTYHLNDNLALNTAAGITRHTFSAGGAVLGKASMAPFHLMLQYHFMPKSAFSPYVGAGIHHTVFFDKSGPTFDTLRGFPADTGGVLEIGFDYAINKDYFINVDLKKFYLKTDVLPGGGGAKIETLTLDPLLVGVAVGMHF
ncbi:MAG: OmpW family outer membrane protein [Pseudomonadota bacterium]